MDLPYALSLRNVELPGTHPMRFHLLWLGGLGCINHGHHDADGGPLGISSYSPSPLVCIRLTVNLLYSRGLFDVSKLLHDWNCRKVYRLVMHSNVANLLS